MSLVSSIAGNQQQYFPTNQNQARPAPTKQSTPAATGQADAAATSSVAPAAANQTADSSNSEIAKSQPTTNANTGRPQIASGTSGAKTIESAATRNGDGTFGPKHTLRPPLSYTLLHNSIPTPTAVDIKA